MHTEDVADVNIVGESAVLEPAGQEVAANVGLRGEDGHRDGPWRKEGGNTKGKPLVSLVVYIAESNNIHHNPNHH